MTGAAGDVKLRACVTKGRPSVTIYDNEQVRARTGIAPDGASFFTLADKGSNPVLILSVDKDGVLKTLKAAGPGNGK
jgi:hypothetical protein